MRYDFHVVRVHAIADPAQVVNLHALGDGSTNQQLVGIPVRPL